MAQLGVLVAILLEMIWGFALESEVVPGKSLLILRVLRVPKAVSSLGMLGEGHVE